MPFLKNLKQQQKNINMTSGTLRLLKNVTVQLFCSPDKQYKFISSKSIEKRSFFSGKVSLCGSPCSRGSMTVEAAIILPFFLFVILSFLSFIEMLRLQNGITMGLREAGMPMTVYAYGYTKMSENTGINLTGVLPNLALSYAYAGGQVEEFLGEDYLGQAPFAYETGRIQYYRSSLLEKDDVIDLVAQYSLVPDFNAAGLPSLRLTSRFFGRAWTGYEVDGRATESLQEENVYITPEGTVYHRNRYCTHLQLTISTCSIAQAQEQYRPCAFCGAGAAEGKVYITPEGDCYHTSIKCSGLKRTIDVVPISQVGEETPAADAADKKG